MKNLEVLYLTSRSIEQCKPNHKQNQQKVEKLKQSNKSNILIAKTLDLLPRRLDPFKNTYFKNMFKTNFYL